MSCDGLSGIWQGTVRSNVDPLGLHRIQVDVPNVQGKSLSTWARAKESLGTYRTPAVGDGVWIEFQDGDITAPVWSGGFIGSAQENPLDAAALAQPEQVILITTPGGRHLKLSDLATDQGLVLKAGNAVLEVRDSGIVIDNGNGARIELKGKTTSINGTALEVT
jgi:hypothetical protein